MNEEKFAKVYETLNNNLVEIPVESDLTIHLSTLTAQFPGCTGLKYLSESGAYRGVKCQDDKLFLPQIDWSKYDYLCVFPNNLNLKRKASDEESENPIEKFKRLENKKCTDLIVLNLSWKTSDNDLREYFSKFGNLVLAQIKRDSHSNKSRGYGFIRFTDYESQVLCLAEKHVINDRTCNVKIPNSKSEGDKQEVSKKIHVDRLTEDVSQEMLREVFSKYGPVTDIFMPKPFRRFAFVTFESSEVAANLIGQEIFISDECSAIVRSAVPKPTGTSTKSDKSVEDFFQTVCELQKKIAQKPLPFLTSIFNSNSAEATAATLAAKYTRAHYKNK